MLYEYSEKLGDSYEIAGTFKVNETRGLASQLSLVFGASGADISKCKLAILSSRDGSGNVENLNYTNGFRSAGTSWTNATNPSEREWALPAVGKSMNFVIKVENRQIIVILDGKQYGTYGIADSFDFDSTAWGFYVDGANITMTHLYYGEIRNDGGEGGGDETAYDTNDGDDSNLVDGATVRLLNLDNINPAPVVWKERKDGTLTHDSLSRFNAILYEYEDYFGDSYEIAGTIKVNSTKGLESQLSIVFGAGEIDGAFFQAAMLAQKDENGNVANLNYTNGFRGAGMGWTAKSIPSERNWSLPAAGESVDFVVRVVDRYVTVILNGEEYEAYYIQDEINFGSIAWGFYADGVNAAVSDLYFGNVRDDSTPTTDENSGPDITRNTDDGENNNVDTGEAGYGFVFLLISAATFSAALIVSKKRKNMQTSR
jgi:hypothetical protein